MDKSSLLPVLSGLRSFHGHHFIPAPVPSMEFVRTSVHSEPIRLTPGPSRFFHPCFRALRTHPSPSGSPPCSSSGAGHFAPALPLVCQFRYHSPLPALAPPAGRFAPVPVPIKSSSGLSAGTLTCPSFVPRGLGT